MENNNIYKNNLKKLTNVEPSRNIQILTMVINNNIYNLNDFNLNYILMPFLIHNNKQKYYNPQKNAFVFPEAIDIDSLNLFCTFLLTPEKVNMNKYTHLKKILNVCIFFNAIEVINNITHKYILSNLNKDNCLDIIIYLYDFIYTENEIIKNIFINITEEALKIISQNLNFFLNNMQAELYSLNNEILEEIVKVYLKENDNNIILNNDIKNVLELLIYSRGISSDIFLLLENERKYAINRFESLFNQNLVKEPTFTWNITYDDIKKHNYQETTTHLDNLNILLISYYDYITDSFQLAIQILNKNDTNNLKTEKKENDFLINTSTAKKINNDQVLLSEENKDKENSLINILSLCEISEINYKSHINFNGIYTKNNSRFLVCKIDNFTKKFKNKKNIFEFSLKIYFSRNYIFPKIIEYICQNFDKYYNLPSINKIPRSAMNILLKNDNISDGPNKEKYKLVAIENWIKFKNGNISKKYIDIFKNIDWKKLDNETLIDFFMKNANMISKEQSLKNDIFFEIQRRFQEEYLSYYLNNKTFMTNSKSFSISNCQENQDNNNNYLSFTFDFLTKILLYLISNNKNNIESEYSTKGKNSKDLTFVFSLGEEKEINFPKTQRSNYPKHKISQNTFINNSPLSNEDKKDHLKYKNDSTNKIINENKIYQKKNKNNNSNIPTNRYGKKSSNNSLNSYQINISGFSGIEYANSGSGNISLFNNKNIINQQKSSNPNVNKGIKSFTPNNSKTKFIIKNNKEYLNYKYNKTVTSKPSRIQFKKGHSKSLDKDILLNREKKIPIDLSEKKIGLFPNYIKNIIHNDNKNKEQNHKNINQIKKKFHTKENVSNKIPIQYYNDEIKNNKKGKISLIICRNDGIFSKMNKNNSKYKI